jgi:hypothetical protein
MSIEANRTDILNHSLKAVSLERVKEHIKVLEDDEDFLIQTYIQSATSMIEKWTGYLLMPADAESYYTEGCGCCRNGFLICLRPFISIEMVEVMQDGSYVEVDSANYTVSQMTWETVVCISSSISVDSTVDCAVDQVKISYKLGKTTEVSVAGITTTTLAGASPQLATVTTTVPHLLTTYDQVSLSATGVLMYDGVFTVTVLNSTQFTIEYEGSPAGDAVTGLCTIPQIPPELQLAIMKMVGMMYSNRGDCSDDCGSIPCVAQSLASSFRRYNIMGAGASNVCYC